MNIEIIKEKLNDYVGHDVVIRYDLGRNKYESYQVKIKKLYNYIFLVETINKEIKSFSYSDVIMNTIKIDYWLKFTIFYIVFVKKLAFS